MSRISWSFNSAFLFIILPSFLICFVFLVPGRKLNLSAKNLSYFFITWYFPWIRGENVNGHAPCNNKDHHSGKCKSNRVLIDNTRNYTRIHVPFKPSIKFRKTTFQSCCVCRIAPLLDTESFSLFVLYTNPFCLPSSLPPHSPILRLGKWHVNYIDWGYINCIVTNAFCAPSQPPSTPNQFHRRTNWLFESSSSVGIPKLSCAHLFCRHGDGSSSPP